MKIDSAEIVIYDTEGNSITFDLNKLQLAMIIKLLGLAVDDDKTMACYSNATLEQFMEMKGNPLRLQQFEA